MPDSSRPSLRQRKFARTRLALAEAVTNHLAVAAFDTLSVKALCERVQISEATFFNYFPRKEDLIVYLDRLWTLELNWYGRQAAQQGMGLAVIEALFRYTSIQIQKKPGLMAEIIAHEALSRERREGPDITPAERMSWCGCLRRPGTIRSKWPVRKSLQSISAAPTSARS